MFTLLTLDANPVYDPSPETRAVQVEINVVGADCDGRS
jgi:hypothetical protein